MIVSKKDIKTSLFTLKINNLGIKLHSISWILLDDKLSWKYHIQKLHKKLSKQCGLIFKLRQYVPLSTRKLIYYSMFQSTLLYSLINWRRAAKSYLYQLGVLQNKFLRASIFLPKTVATNLLFFKIQKL